MRIVLPVSLTVVLFGMTIFLLLIPLIEEKLLDGKREMIRELTESSWSILDAHAAKVQEGALRVWPVFQRGINSPGVPPNSMAEMKIE